MKILFIDDELDAMNDHINALVNAGHEVTMYRTTDDALDVIGVRRHVGEFEAVVLDMMIPPPVRNPHPHLVWDGLRSGGHLLLEIRRHSESVPVLILSNLDEEEVQLECWDRFVEWRTLRKLDLPKVYGASELRESLRKDFRTMYRSKRRTPPWAFPKVLDDLVK